MRVSGWTSIIDHDRYARLAAILRLPHASPIDPLPPTWHWLYTHESPIDTPLGCDGHVAERPYGVPESHTFRLWAGSEIHSHRAHSLARTLDFGFASTGQSPGSAVREVLLSFR